VKKTIHLAIGLVAICCFAMSLLAQTDTGSISGTVSDSSGALIPGVTVTVRNLGTNAVRSAHTNSEGAYAVTGLSAATYEVKLEVPGFQPFTSKAEVTVGARVTLDAQLSVTSASTQVEVVAQGGAEVNTQTQELSQIVNQQQVATLPSLTRNPYDFVAISGNISGGDSSTSGDSRATGNQQNAATRGVGYNINGQRSSGTEILLDGVENINVFTDAVGIYVPVDATQEFRVITNNFEPQYGRASGGIVNVTTKSGSNAFHGDIWEFNRLSAYTANTVTNAQEGLPKGTYTRNQFGFTVGGPIIKDKLFAFGGTEWTRVRSTAVARAAVPTPEFISTLPANVQEYFNAHSGGKQFSFLRTYSASELGLTGIPPNTPAFGITSYTVPSNAGGSIPQNTYNIVGRFDYNFSSRTQAFFRYVNYNEEDQIGGIFGSPYSQYNVGQTFQNQAYLLSVSHVFNPSIVENTKLSFSRFNVFQTYDTSLQNTPTLYAANNSNLPGTSTPILMPGFFSTSPAIGGLPFGGPQNTIQVNQDLSVQKGRHTTQFGAQFLYIQDNQAYGAYAQAAEQLGISTSAGLQNMISGTLYQFSAAVDPRGALPCVANQYTLELAQTPACSVALPATSPSFARSNRFFDWAVYAQDSWKATPRLNVNYGVRYEYYGVQNNNRRELDSNFYYANNSFSPINIRNGQVFTTPTSPIGRLWNPQYGTVSPRVGFAYDISGKGRTVLRAGYGISYERNFGNVTFNVIQNPPAYAVVVVDNAPVTASNAGPLAGSTGSVPLPPTSLRNVDQNIRTAQSQFWSAALERQLLTNTMVSLQYFGSRGIHLYDIKNINGLGGGNVLVGDPVTDAAGNQALTRLNPQYSNINNRGSGGDSYYQGLNVQFQTTDLRHTGLSLVANYTYAHQQDDLSTTFSETNNNFANLGYTDPFNPALDRGNGDFDIRHRLALAPIYKEPYFAHSSNAFLRQALGGWQVAGIYTIRSGAPFTFFDSTNNISGYNVPRYTPASGFVPQRRFTAIPSGTSGQGTNTYIIGTLPAADSWSNPALLGASDWGPYPSTMTARNAFRGPGAWNLDLAVIKTFPIREHVNLEFRAEGFNIFNHHNLYIQGASNDVANYTPDALDPQIIASKGGIGFNGGANDERRFGQFALRLSF
jgi:Carboxypeptidase regulatory-like domain/TonB dependent receptor